MQVNLVPRAAPSDRLRVWVGVLANQQPVLRWFLDGAEVVPHALRPFSSAIPAELLGDRAAENFIGVYEFSGLQAGTAYLVRVQADGVGHAELRTKTLPAAIPSVLDQPFNILLVSCFHAAEDRAGHAGTVAGQLTGRARPDLTLLLGDQVYLDLPTLANFPDDASRLARKFEGDYRANWQSDVGYARLLALAPTASLPDDHEYWNNFPHSSPIIQNSWKRAGRENWTAAAAALYEAFQFSYEPETYYHGDPAQLGDAAVIDVEPVSLFLADGRSKRDPARRWVLTERGKEQLEHWVEQTILNRRTGIFVTGQSLLDAAASKLEGRVADYAMPNYEDFRDITQTLGRISDAGLPLLLVTGDVHWGRVASVKDIQTGRPALYEIISSPTSLVSSVGQDQWRAIWGAIRGGGDAWPRHSEAAAVPDFLWSGAFGKRFHCERLHPQKGNHIAQLSFVRAGAGVRLHVTYYPIHGELAHRQPTELEELVLFPS